LEADASANNNASNTAASGEFKVELEGEQVWLSGLHDFIQQGLCFCWNVFLLKPDEHMLG